MKIARELETKENNLYFKSKIWYHNKKKIKQRPLWYSKTKQKKKKMKELLPDQSFHANLIYVKN